MAVASDFYEVLDPTPVYQDPREDSPEVGTLGLGTQIPMGSVGNKEGLVWVPVIFKEQGQTRNGFVRLRLAKKEKNSRFLVSTFFNRGSQGPRTISDSDGGLVKTNDFVGSGYGVTLAWETPLFTKASGFLEGGFQSLNLAGKTSPESSLVSTAESDAEVKHTFFAFSGGVRKSWRPLYLGAGLGGWQSIGSKTYIGGSQVSGDSRPLFFHFFGEAGIEWGSFWRIGLRFGFFSNTQPVVNLGNVLATWGFAL